MNLKIVAAILAALMLCAALPAWSQGFGGMGRHFGRMGVNGGTHKIVTPDCANPTTGQIDLSVCSNSIYLTLVLI